MTQPEITSLPYEQAQQELHELVEKMENGDLPLEELLQGYERATALRKHCEQLLDHAEQRIKVLQEENGEQRLEPLAPAPENPSAAEENGTG